jgi:hypothetical protein
MPVEPWHPLQGEPIWKAVEPHAAAHGERVALVFEDAGYSYADIQMQIRRAASGLGAALLGSIHVPINAPNRGEFLRHQLATAAAGTMLCDQHLLPRLVDLPEVRQVVVREEPDAEPVDGVQVAATLEEFFTAKPRDFPLAGRPVAGGGQLDLFHERHHRPLHRPLAQLPVLGLAAARRPPGHRPPLLALPLLGPLPRGRGDPDLGARLDDHHALEPAAVARGPGPPGADAGRAAGAGCHPPPLRGALQPQGGEAVGTALDGRASWDQWESVSRLSSYDAARQMWSRTDFKPADVDIAQLYDGLTIPTLLWLESLGFCGEGEGGHFVEGGARIARRPAACPDRRRPAFGEAPAQLRPSLRGSPPAARRGGRAPGAGRRSGGRLLGLASPRLPHDPDPRLRYLFLCILSR